MKTKSILVKSIAVTALSVSGLIAINNMNSETAHAAVVQNDASVFTAQVATTVYNNYENPVATGQTLPSNTDWKVIKTAYDSKGQKWYDLGKNQWVKASVVVKNAQTKKHVQTQTAQPAQTQATVNTSAKQTYSAPKTSQKSTTHYTSSATGSEASAKAWIASQESGSSYSSRNGQYIGKYQLSASYLGGDYSAANQERAADNYVKSRYGSWSAAKSFWQSNGYY